MPASSQVLLTGVRSITNLILTPGLINLDFADVNSVMKDQGLALMGVGEAAGDGRAERAVRAALKNPLLESTDISEARGVLVSFCGSGDLSLYEVEEALAEYHATADRKLGNDMLARAAGPHVDVMDLLLSNGAEPSLIDKEGNTVDATQIVQTYRALSGKGADEADGAKDEL